MYRAASQATQSILDAAEEEDRGAYNEEIINICSKPVPNPYFESDEFLEIFEQQCQQMSILCCISLISRDYFSW